MCYTDIEPLEVFKSGVLTGQIIYKSQYFNSSESTKHDVTVTAISLFLCFTTLTIKESLPTATIYVTFSTQPNYYKTYREVAL